MTKERWERIKQIFEDALERAPGERDLFVARICGDDSSLRLEVESLLAGDSQADHFMERPAVAGFATHFGVRPRTFQSGDTVSGRFKIVRFIGEGGMGEVYEAEDLEFNAHVALKTIRPEIAADEGTLARFKQEVQLTRRVTHPNVCRTFDLAHHYIPGAPGSAETDVTYLTMELLEGETLAERLRRGRMTTQEMLPLVRQMAEALDAAHSAGVIHRDFKPANVILCQRSASGAHEDTVRAVVTDFGLARGFSGADDFSQSLTRSGLVIGTLAYMAPEQAEGKEITAATDIYALGLTLYEMATGARPFSDNGPFGPVIQRLKEPAPSPRTAVPGLDSRYESAISKCLEIDPRRRFASAREVIQALGGGEESRSGSGLVRDWLQGRLRRSLLFSGIALALLAILGSWVYRRAWFSGNQHGTRSPMRSGFVKFTADRGLTYMPAVSFDGKKVAYSSDRAGDGILNIWVQDAAEGGTAFQVTRERRHALDPSFSPDGSEIAFVATGDGSIYVVSIRDQSKRLVALDGHQPRFSPDGSKILYWSGSWTGDTVRPSFQPTGKLYVAPAKGGVPQRIQGHFADARYPVWLPDGRHLLFQGATEALGSVMEASDWWIADLSQDASPPIKTGAFTVLRKNSINLFQNAPQWWNNSIVFSGRLGESNNLFQVRVSPRTWQVESDPEKLTFGTGLEIDPAVSSTGRLFFANWDILANVWALPLGPGSFPAKESSLKQLTAEASVDLRPSISVDGKKLVFGRAWGRDRNVWLKDLAIGKETSLTSSYISDPVVSRDGAKVAYSLEELSKRPIEILAVDTLARKRACGDCGEPLDWSWDGSALLYSFEQPEAIGLLEPDSGQTTLLLKSANALGPASFCPRDRCIIFAEWLDGAHSRLWLAPVHGHRPIPQSEWTPLTDGRFADDKPRLSADGHSVYFQSHRDGFSCLWGLRLDPATGQARGGPFPVLHLHRASFSLSALSQASFDMRVAADKLVFNAMTNTGNLWWTDLSRDK